VTRARDKNSPFQKQRIVIAIIIVAAMMVLCILIIIGKLLIKREVPPVRAPLDTIPKLEEKSRTMPITPVRPETSFVVAKKPAIRKIPRIDTTHVDTAHSDRADIAVTVSTTSPVPALTNPCAHDTQEIWDYPEPSGGLHHGPVAFRFRSNKPCTIFWQFSSDTSWREYNDETVRLDTSAVVLFNAVDSCGREMPTREELYEIEVEKKTEGCPDDMELVKIGSMRFCVDRYEWPNRKGIAPASFISLYQASDSCFSRGKRLCTSEEWSLACGGPYSWNYPYGQQYEINACVTNDTAPRTSGAKSECRAYFGIFDMSGNLAEWTATPSKENRQFNNVMGGFWESGPRSGCHDTRYSYFPQNRHNPVGFRCCRDHSNNDRH